MKAIEINIPRLFRDKNVKTVTSGKLCVSHSTGSGIPHGHCVLSVFRSWDRGQTPSGEWKSLNAYPENTIATIREMEILYRAKQQLAVYYKPFDTKPSLFPSCQLTLHRLLSRKRRRKIGRVTIKFTQRYSKGDSFTTSRTFYLDPSENKHASQSALEMAEFMEKRQGDIIAVYPH